MIILLATCHQTLLAFQAAANMLDRRLTPDLTAIIARSGQELRVVQKGATVQRRLLAIYLNDHLAGSTVGLELARRTARENVGNNPLGAFLSEVLVPEIAEDRETLRSLMARLGIAQSGVKVSAGWLLEKLGRAKLNGEWRRYSPLSRLLELEGLTAGIEAKRAMWVALAEIHDGGAAWEAVDLQQLAERAQSQRERLEEHRLAAAATALR